MRASHFGSPAGKWEFVCRRPRGISWYVYVPFEIVNGLSDAPEVENQFPYWYYSGPNEPSTVTIDERKIWVFKANRPDELRRFKSLPKPIQKYLKDRYGKEEDYIDQAEQPSSVPRKVGFSFSSLKAAEKPQSETSIIKLSPLALGLWVSNQVCQNQVQLAEISKMYCSRISEVFMKARTELWVNDQNNSWKCLSTQDGSEGIYSQSLLSVEFFPMVNEQNILTAPILLKRGEEDEIIGALILGGADMEKISVDAIQAYSRMIIGVVSSARS
jgi:hypothetical protein